MSERIGVIGAMANEVKTLIEEMSCETASTIAGMTFHEGTLSGADVVVVQCGVGKVSAAMCAQALIDRFGVTKVINTGIAGSLDNVLDIGDLVVSTDAVQHDMDAGGIGCNPGVIPFLDVLSFPADEELRTVALAAARAVAPDITARAGRIASGDQFICTAEQRKRIIDTFGARCCEMEGGAIAQVCWRNDVPYVIVRAISDKADGSSTMDYLEFEEKAARHCAAIVTYALGILAG